MHDIGVLELFDELKYLDLVNTDQSVDVFEQFTRLIIARKSQDKVFLLRMSQIAVSEAILTETRSKNK